MKLKVKSANESIANGSYLAKFKGIEDVPPPPNHLDWGDSIRWKFETIKDGKKVGRITKPNPTAKTICGKILSGVRGRDLQVGEEIDLNEYIDKTYLIVVQDGKVETVSLPPS